MAASVVLPGVRGYATTENSDDELSILRPASSHADHSNSKAETAEEPPTVRQDWRRWAFGVNYIGAQLRWRPSSRWAFEGAYQQDKASSNYGDVTARVYGLRAYRFFHPRPHWSLYWGPEFAYTTAKPETSNYKTSGVVIGGFMGSEIDITRRLALDVDLGPYVISLKESETGINQTNLDFVIQTALLFNLF